MRTRSIPLKTGGQVMVYSLGNQLILQLRHPYRGQPPGLYELFLLRLISGELDVDNIDVLSYL